MFKYNEPDIIIGRKDYLKMKGLEYMTKRTFTAEFKAKIVLELLKGEKELNVIASENEIAPNQLRKLEERIS